MDAPGGTELPVPYAGQFIDTDVVCRRCSYNLRGLYPEGRCPECGTPVGISLQGDLLRFAEPAWVEILARGIRFILWGIALYLVAAVLGGVLSELWEPVIGEVVNFLGSLLGVYGAWLLTVPDPSGIGEDRYVTARKIIRFALVVGLLSDVAWIVLAAGGLAPAVMFMVWALMLVTGLVGVVGEFAKFYYLELLAKRIPDLRLAGHARFIRWAYAILMAVMVLVGGIGFLLAQTSAAGASGGIVCGVGCVGIAFLVVIVAALVLQWRLGRAFREQARVARVTWASAAGAGGEVNA